MKLEAGMYVRTKEGYICKILKTNELCEDDGYLDHNDIGSANIQEKNIIKASYDIIDLIKVGDYVNGYKVVQIGKSIEGRKYITTEAYHKINYGNIFEKEIKSIVTKEQFEKISYKVGD